MLRAYLAQMPSLAAERQLQRIEASVFPYMQDRSRQSLFRKLQRALSRTAAEKRKTSTPEDFAALGIPVTYVKADQTE